MFDVVTFLPISCMNSGTSSNAPLPLGKIQIFKKGFNLDKLVYLGLSAHQTSTGKQNQNQTGFGGIFNPS